MSPKQKVKGSAPQSEGNGALKVRIPIENKARTALTKSRKKQVSAIGQVIDNFESKAKQLGIQNPKKSKDNKDDDVTDLVKELLDIASTMKKNRVQLPQMLDGAAIAAGLKKSGVQLNAFQTFLDSVYERSTKKNISLTEIIAQCERISSLEKKYGKSFSQIKDDYGNLAKQASVKSKLVASLERKINTLESKKSELESQFASQKKEIQAYQRLRSIGIDGERIFTWDKIAQNSGINQQEVEKELQTLGNLSSLEEKLKKRISNLKEEDESLRQSTLRLEQEMKNVQAEIAAIKQGALNEISELNSKVLSSYEDLNEKSKSSLVLLAIQNEKAITEIKQASQKEIKSAAEQMKMDLTENVSELSSSIQSFTKGLRVLLDEASPQIKTISQALEAGEKIGKYKTILPLLELMEKGKGDEVESLITIWNISNRFNMWLNEHYGNSRKDISEPLSKLLSAVNEEIQRVGK